MKPTKESNRRKKTQLHQRWALEDRARKDLDYGQTVLYRKMAAIVKGKRK